jgi:hypothetical protein
MGSRRRYYRAIAEPPDLTFVENNDLLLKSTTSAVQEKARPSSGAGNLKTVLR